MRELAPGEARLSEVPALRCRCSRCDAEFLVVSEQAAEAPTPPARCRACRSPYWRIPRGTLQRGRPSRLCEAICIRCARRFPLRSADVRRRPEGWELEAFCPWCEDSA